MRYYRSYMDRQEVSPQLHERLMELDLERQAPRRHWMRYGALAACAALVLGVGAWALSTGSGPEDGPIAAAGSQEPTQALPPEASQAGDTQPTAPPDGFVVRSPAEGDKLPFPTVPEISYQDMSHAPEVAASRAHTPGAFLVDLGPEDIQGIFWGPEGRPEPGHPKMEQGDLPWALFWDGYTLRGAAWYDGQGQLTELTIYGEKGRASFTLELRLGALPFSCALDMSREDRTSEFNGVEITAWSRAYDRDGDGLTDYICGSEFMTEDDIGVRFENRNSSMRAEYGGSSDMELGGSCTFNALFVRQALTGGLHLDHLLAAGYVPAWREVSFDTLEQARQEADFAPYLPTSEPEGYSAYTGDKDFHGHLSYQEDRQNTLFVRWSRGYDDVEVCVYRDGYRSYILTDPADPASYDVRLYEIPWCDSVPEQYRESVDRPAFRAEDMSLAIVEARGMEKDTGGTKFAFEVLYPDGTLVSYHCSGMTAQQVWEMMESTLA